MPPENLPSADAPTVPHWLFRLRRLLRFRTIPFDGFSLVGYRNGVPKGMIHMIARGDYETPEREAVKAVLRPGDRVVEIGACLGVVSLTAARIVGANSVFAYEPNPAAAAVARENFRRNRLDVAIVQRAVGAKPGRLDLGIGEGSWLGAAIGHHFMGGSRVGVEIEAIGDIVARHRPTVLVMDAEGAEAEILPACPLDGLRAIVLELHEDPTNPEHMGRLRRLLAAEGFTRNPKLGAASGLVATEVWLR